MPVSEALYQQVALADPEGNWELICGRLREKPPMTMEHNRLQRRLALIIGKQMDMDRYEVDSNGARVQVSGGNHYVPDVVVLPMWMIERLGERPGAFEVYTEPVPFVAEVWSPSTGVYDVDTKFPEYKKRGDLEIWRVHPYERAVIIWRRQPDGSYTEERVSSGVVELAALPGVRVDIDALFA